MLLSRVVALLGLLAFAPAHALKIETPTTAENGSAITVYLLPATPLTSGQQLEVRVNGEPAAQLKVVAGKVTSFRTRVKGAREETAISARVLADGSVREQATNTVKVTIPVSAAEAPTSVGKILVRNRGGDVLVLIDSKSGFSGTLVVRGKGFHVEVTGSGIISQNSIIGLTGDIAGEVTVSIDGITTRVAETSPPPAVPNPTTPVAPRKTAVPVTPSGAKTSAPKSAPRETAKSTKQIADEIGARYDQRIQAARGECKSKMDSCETRCATKALGNLLGRSGNTTAHLDCTNNCNKDRDQCIEQANGLEREKRQAIAAALAPPPPPQPPPQPSSVSSGSRAGASTRSDDDAWTKRVCDTKCAMIVAESKCKHIRDNEQNLRCKMSHGIINPDTPELCAQAKAVSGCVTRAERDASRKKAKFPAPSNFETVCDRNVAMIEKVFWEKPIHRSNALYDMMEINMQREVAEIYKPCTNQSTNAARRYQQAMEIYEKGKRHCAGPHDRDDCTPWGSSGGVGVGAGGEKFDNQAYYRQWRGEVDKALSNPNYSAELGPIGGAGAVDKADTACRVALDDIAAQHKAAERQIPKDSVVVKSEALMWMIAKANEAIQAKCPNSKHYAAQVDSNRKTYADTKRACDGMAAHGPCQPRLPGKEPAKPPVPVASKPLPPLDNNKVSECGKPPSASAIKCLEAKCAKLGGFLKPADRGCVACRGTEGNDWFACPDGRNSAQ